MNTKKKSESSIYLEKLTGAPLSLGKFLESIRLGDDISQVEFAKMLGVSKSYLCDIEKGRKCVSPMKAREYAEILGYSSTQFVRLAFQDQLNKMGMHFEVRFEKLKSPA